MQQLETSITEKLRKAEDMVTYAINRENICPMKFLKENFHLKEIWKLDQMSDSKKNWMLTGISTIMLEQTKHGKTLYDKCHQCNESSFEEL